MPAPNLDDPPPTFDALRLRRGLTAYFVLLLLVCNGPMIVLIMIHPAFWGWGQLWWAIAMFPMVLWGPRLMSRFTGVPLR